MTKYEVAVEHVSVGVPKVLVYDLAPATEVESAIRERLTGLGWVPPDVATQLREDADILKWLENSDWYVGPGNFYCDEAGGLNDYDNKNDGNLRLNIRQAMKASN